MKKILAVLMSLAFVATSQLAFAKGNGGGNGAGNGNGNGNGNGKAAHKLSPKKRLKIQHHRIKEGVKNGTINKDEAKQLHQEGKEINEERKADLAKDGGKLNDEDRKDLENKLDDRSKEIYNDKHPDTANGGNGNNNNQ